MSVDIGFDMRNDPGYVTDPANCTYLLGTLGGDAYPVMRDGYTFGWDPDAGGLTIGGADRDSGNDPRIAGINYLASGANAPFQLDIPAGTYNVYLAIGDAAGGTGRTQIDVYDGNSSLLFSVVQVSTSANFFTDAQGNEYSNSDWPSMQEPRQIVTTESYMRIKLNNFEGSAFPGLAFFGIADATPPAAGNPWLFYRNQMN